MWAVVTQAESDKKQEVAEKSPLSAFFNNK